MLDRGKIAVLTILVLAVSLAAFAVWWRYSQGRRAAEFWGPEAAHLILRAPQVELLELEPVDPLAADESSDGEQIRIGDAQYQVLSAQHVENSPGLIHARHALTEDASFDWPETMFRPDHAPHWDYGVRFSDGDHSVTVVFDFGSNQIQLASGQQSALLVPRIAKGWRNIVERATQVDKAKESAKAD